jgi:hypothetical protein
MATIEREKTGKPAALLDNDNNAGIRNAQVRTPWKNRNASLTVH